MSFLGTVRIRAHKTALGVHCGKGKILSEVHHFTFGFITPGMAYVMSVAGCALGLICTRRARQVLTPLARTGWLALAAVTIGGAGVWLMHFLAMIGFTVEDAEIRYNIALTALSAVVAILVVGIGLFLVCRNERSIPRLMGAGIFTGSGIAGMHYIGMWSMRVSGNVSYNPRFVVASIIIAIIVATVALWFALVVSGPLATTVAALIMGGAVAGMHYTAMAGVSVAAYETPAVQGTQLINVLIPTFFAVCVLLVVPLYIFLGLSTDEPSKGKWQVRLVESDHSGIG